MSWKVIVSKKNNQYSNTTKVLQNWQKSNLCQHSKNKKNKKNKFVTKKF